MSYVQKATPLAHASSHGSGGSDPLPGLLTSLEPSSSQRIFKSVLGNSATPFTMISGTAYFVYVGRTVKAVTPQYVKFHVTTGGTGAQAAETGLFSSPLAPNGSAQTMTLIEATATVDDLTSTGMKGNTAAFTTEIPADTHVWAALRVAMATTQPDIIGLENDMEQGHVLSLAGSAVLI